MEKLKTKWVNKLRKRKLIYKKFKIRFITIIITTTAALNSNVSDGKKSQRQAEERVIMNLV